MNLGAPLTGRDLFEALSIMACILGLFTTRFEHNALRERVRRIEDQDDAKKKG